MRFALYVIMMLVVVSCQKEELTVIESNEEQSFLRDSELTTMMASVVSHDGSFDDIVDKSSCFSIDFPYTCYYNGQSYLVNSIEDLAPFSETDYLVPEFPVNITFADYSQATVADLGEFNLLKSLCSSGEIYNQTITCLDLLYPVDVAIYNQDNSEFETITFEHDKQTFLSIREFNTETIAKIQYPIEILIHDKDILIVNSNEQLKTIILNMIPLCE